MITRLLIIVIIISALIITAQPSDVYRDSRQIGFSPKVWGPGVWSCVHTCSMAFPRDPNPCQRRALVNLWKSLVYTLPCKACRTCYSALINIVPPEPFVDKGRAGAFAYSWLIHNLVNFKINVAPMAMSDAARLWLGGAATVDVESTVAQLLQDVSDRRVDWLITAYETPGRAFMTEARK